MRDRDRDRVRRAIDDRLSSARSIYWRDGGGGRFVRTGRARAAHSASCRQFAPLRLSATGLERETAPFSPARVMARLAGRLLSSFLSPVVKYHGLGRASGFGSLRPCNTLTTLHGAPETASPTQDWLDSPERARLPIRPSQTRTLRPASFRAAFPLGPRLTAPSEIDNQTVRAFDRQLTLSFTGCPTRR